MSKKGQKLWIKAKKIIPGGNMLLSKRSEMFLPDLWPSYFSKAKGCKVWDLDGNEFIDMSIMGIGTNILGYGNDEVDEAVRSVINKGNMSTFNCPEEVYLSEKLLSIHPWADMVKFARSGGEANSIAVRIARAASKVSTRVAVCGYHGWHDWYLSANLTNNDNLENHLLPGLSSNGVPKELEGTIYPFNYNDLDYLKKIIQEKKIGVIKMEVMRNVEPKDDFLHKVRELANENNIILIFDECTSGFRKTFGGLHKFYSVEPDIAIFGKALGNGYAITAVIGKESVMQYAQETFISSTFWTERIGPTAALKTLEVMEREKSWETVSLQGEYLRKCIEELSKKYSLKIMFSGISAILGFSFISSNNLVYKTFITQEMLKKGFLASNLTYVSIEHTNKVINRYISNLDPIFKTISECEKSGDTKGLLESDICHTGFNRLN